jgi:hypothetical protein
MRTPSPPPKKIQHGLAMLYDNIFHTAEEYCKFTVNWFVMWGNTLEYKLFDNLYTTHRHNSHTIKKLRKQAMALLEEANKINKQDMLVHHRIESHVQNITRSDLRQQIEKPQQVRVIISPVPIPGPSHQPDNSHCATYGQNYAK